MNEARYSITVKVNSDLFTVRGDTAEEFAENVAAATNLVAYVKQLQASAGAVPVIAQPAPVVKPAEQVIQDTFGGTTVDLYNLPAETGHSCAHGARQFKQGFNKAGKPYKGWYCPQLSPDCKVEWVK